MKEFILALLLTKFVGVRKDGLAQLAGTLALQADKEDEATSLVEKFTPEKVTNFVKDWRADVDKEVSNSTKTFEQTLKEKYDLTEKKELNPNPNPTPANPNPTDIASIIAAEIAKAVTPLQQQLSNFRGQEVNKSRLQVLSEKLAGIQDETFKAKTLKDFSRMSFETDDQFNEYLTDTETDVTAFNQSQSDKGMSGHAKPFMGVANNDGVSAGVAAYIASKTAGAAGSALEGKQL